MRPFHVVLETTLGQTGTLRWKTPLWWLRWVMAQVPALLFAVFHLVAVTTRSFIALVFCKRRAGYFVALTAILLRQSRRVLCVVNGF